jgi:hypothetical protein
MMAVKEDSAAKYSANEFVVNLVTEDLFRNEFQQQIFRLMKVRHSPH